MAQSNVSHEDSLRLLHSLSCSKFKILNKDRNTKTFSQTDIFEFNSKFTDRMRRIKIPLASMDERTKVLEDVDKDRRYAIDAAVVRVMKSRKVLPHQQLVSECVEQQNHVFKSYRPAFRNLAVAAISEHGLDVNQSYATYERPLMVISSGWIK